MYPHEYVPLLEVKDLHVHFLGRREALPAVTGVSFTLRQGETLGLVGESGSGKSLTCFSIMQMLPHRSARIVAGEVLFEGVDLLGLTEAEMRRLRGSRISMILQDPMTSLNPLFTVGTQIAEGVSTHRRIARGEARQVARTLLERMHVSAPKADPDARMRQFPHQMSGGQRQRVVGAMALSGEPSLIIADEPTTSLDVTIQAHYLRLLKAVQQDTGAALIFVTHDLGIVARICDRVAVMYAGTVVEAGPVNEVFAAPKHPYTQGLLNSLVRTESAESTERRLYSIPGQPPTLRALPPGCSFAPRCPHAMDVCTEPPPEVAIGEHRTARCWLNVADPGRGRGESVKPAVQVDGGHGDG